MKLNRSINGRVQSVTALLALSLLTGCRGPWSEGWKVSDMWSMDASPWSSDDSPQTPQRIVGSWTDTVLHTSGKTPQRGFGGRLIFYGEEADKPILVEGQLVVYAFDETNRDPTDSKPTRRYVFPPDQVARRMSKTGLGPSYSFWLPWDDVGGPQTEISLIARFEPKKGALIMSEQTRHLLPGASTPAAIASHLAPKLPEGVPAVPAQPSFASLTERAQAAAAAAAPGGVQLASYDAGATQNPADVVGQQLAQEPARRMTTTSISLPENFRITNSGLPQSVRAGDVQLSGNVIAQPTAPPPSRSALAAPMAVPRPGTFPGAQVMQNVQPSQQMQQMQMTPSGFMTLRQSPLGNGFVAPVGGQQFSPQLQTPNTVGQIGVPPAAPVMPGQPPLTTASGWTTTTYSGPAPQLGPRPDLPPPSSGYPPQTLPAQAAPAVR